jgi:hypothetical protein
MAGPATAQATGFEAQIEQFKKPELTGINGGGITSAPQGELRLADAEFQADTVEIPGVINVSELPGDAKLTAEAQRKIKEALVGDFAVAHAVEPKEKPIKNTLEGLLWAAEGDAEGLLMTRTNITTEAVEQAYKVNVIELELSTDSHGNIGQHGQPMDDVQHNAYQLASNDPIIKPRTIAEANNSARIKWLREQGQLKDNVLVVLSLCAEGVSDERLDELKFFSRTKSLSIQTIYERDDGTLVQDVAMIAGVKTPGGERHDRKMVEGFGRKVGVDYEGRSEAEIINHPLLIPRKYLRDGSIDVAAILDEINGGTFMGQDVPPNQRMSYGDYKKFCKHRAESLEGNIDQVQAQLISEAGSFKSAVEAAKRMSKLVEQSLVGRALNDKSIDPSVFGPESAKNLIRARELTAAGKYHEAQAFMQVARATAQGGSCPSAYRDEAAEANEKASKQTETEKWAGTDNPKDGVCVNCKKKRKVGVESWCKGCIKGHCG